MEKMSNLKNKLGLYLGSFISQFSMFLVLIVVVRNSTIEDIATLAIVDGVLLVLPFFLTLVSERSAVIAYYEKTDKTGLKIFATSFILVLSLTIVSLLLWAPSRWIASESVSTLGFFIIMAGAANGLYNIQIQRHIVLENYLNLTKMQIKRGVAIVLFGILFQFLDYNSVHLYPLAIFCGSFIAVSNTIFATFRGWKWKYGLIKSHIKYILRMCMVALLVLFLGYIMNNLGRLTLEINNKSLDLALLLIYLKNTLLVTVALTPVATFFKPHVLKEYTSSRSRLPSHWFQALAFAFFISIGAIAAFNFLWSIWGLVENEPDHVSFAVCIIGAVSMWLTSSIVDLYYEHSNLLNKKIVIYSVPISILTIILFLAGQHITYKEIILVVTITQFGILTLGIFIAFPIANFVKQYFLLIAAIISILTLGFLFNHLAIVLSQAIFATISIFLVLLSGAISMYFLFQYSQKSAYY